MLFAQHEEFPTTAHFSIQIPKFTNSKIHIKRSYFITLLENQYPKVGEGKKTTPQLKLKTQLAIIHCLRCSDSAFTNSEHPLN